MSDNDVNDTISEIMDVLNSGDFDSKKQLEDLTAKLETVFAPAIALEELRFEEIGEHLFEFTWNAKAPRIGVHAKSGSIPMLRFGGERLEKFLMVLERQRMLDPVIRTDPLFRVMSSDNRNHVRELLDKLESTEQENERVICIKILAKFLAHATKDGLLRHTLPDMLRPEMFNLISQHLKVKKMPSGILGTEREVDYRALGEQFLEARLKESQGQETPEYTQMVSIVAALAFYADRPATPRHSQKARGIQVLSQSVYDVDVWLTKPSVPIPLEDALNVTETEMFTTIQSVWGFSVEKFWRDGCFIRTCPASPRAGALENSHTHNVEDACLEMRGLAVAMLDENLPDYDPEGELVMMKFEKPSCSGVMVKGHRHISVGPIYDGATNTRGTLIHLSLQEAFAKKISDKIHKMKLDDGMLFHEIELVWSEDDGPNADKITQQKRLWRPRYNESHSPVCTQIRGLHIDKEPLFAPAVVDGETLFIRGAVPEHGHGDDSEGKVIQKTYIDVEKGDLSDCLELEQMAKNGELPEGLVVYVSAGGPMCHAAGVSREWGFPIVFGQMPYPNGTLWTEIRGWMCLDKEDVEAEPYDPSLTMEYYQIGIEDGDRFWNFGNVALSSFLHTYMSSGVNDPRFEAYLAGVYSMWLVKATLATSLGEMRHAYDGKARMTPNISLRHLLAIKSLCATEEDFYEFEWNVRGDYYGLLVNNRIGLDYAVTLLKNCRDCFASSNWSGSFGGTKYMESVDHAISCARYMKQFANGDVDVNVLLGKVNALENAVHNTGAFFNKFVADKYWFDMATAGGHPNLSRVSWQYHVAAIFHTRFYNRILEESWVCYEGYTEMHDDLLDVKKTRSLAEDDVEMYEKLMDILTGHCDAEIALSDALAAKKLPKSDIRLIENIIETFCLNNRIYCDDCDSYDCGCYSHTKAYHKEGVCGFMHCPNDACQQIAFTQSYGVEKQHLIVARDIFGTHNTKSSLPTCYPKLMRKEDPTLLIAKNWNPMTDYNEENSIAMPLTKEGMDSLPDEVIVEMMMMTPLKQMNQTEYHPESQVWVEPDRDVKPEETVITIDVIDVEFPNESHITENLPPVLVGQTSKMPLQYHWIDGMTHELMRRIWAEFDSRYGIMRDSDNIAFGDGPAEMEILRDLGMLWLQSNKEGVWVDHANPDIVNALKGLLALKEKYTTAGGCALVSGQSLNNQTLEDKPVTLLHSSSSGEMPLWMNTNSFGYTGLGHLMIPEQSLFREVLQDYYKNLNDVTRSLCSPVQSFGNFASNFIERYGTVFVEELAKTQYNSNNNGDEEGSENNE